MIGREQLVEQSVTDFARAFLEARGYSGEYRLLDEFPYVLLEEFEENLISIGFDFDDGGEPAECGSDLTLRTYTIEFFVFGLDRTWARNLANRLKFGLDSEGTVPLKDYEQAGDPVVDHLEVLSVSAQRQTIIDPEPFQENVYTTTIRVQDVYHASLVP